MRLVLFCDAAADFRTVSGIVDRVLSLDGPSWVVDLLESHPESVREWVEDGSARSYFDLHHLTEYGKRLPGFRAPHGHFDGKRGADGALMARTAFHIVRALLKQAAAAGREETVDAVLFVWDMDAQGDERREGLKQAREESARWAPFRIVLGCPDMEREAWVLAGFTPENDVEQQRLDETRDELEFCPCKEAHRLRDKDGASRNLKRVLCVLTNDDRDREARCINHASLEQLRAHGEASGLRAFLDEVKAHVVSLYDQRRAS